MYRIHIVGCGPRTGTTLLTELMTNSFEIDLYTDHEDRIAKAPPRKGKVFLTKSPKDIVVVKPILSCVKKLYVIFMLRDPRDAIVSMHGSDRARYWSNLLYWKNYIPFADEIQNHPRFLSVKYEDLASNPNTVQKTIEGFMPFLQSKNNFSDFHGVSKPSADSVLAMGAVRPISDKSIGNWRNHKPRVLGQIQKYGSISEDLISYGYEQDNSWELDLVGVDPDLRPSHESDFYKKEFISKKLRFKYLRAFRVWFYQSWLILNFLELRFRLFNK